MKLIDVFNYSHEPIELLEMRLRIVYPHVDLICINENATTYTGIERELQFEKHKEHLDFYFGDKIVHRVIDTRERNLDFTTFQQEYHTNRDRSHPARPATRGLPERWHRSMYGRDCLIESPLEVAEDEDIIIQSDLDEIPNPEFLKEAKEIVEDGYMYTCIQKFYMCHVNRLQTDKGKDVNDWRGSQFSTFKYLKEHGGFNDCRNLPHEHEYTIDNGGWHFSFLGGEDKIKQKLNGYGHQEHNHDGVKNSLGSNITGNQDILGRTWMGTRIVPLDSDLPDEIVNNPERYKEFIA
jgi:beta-1,4-mannosyl-glycoprotein beta-1,4-N-acetylglucosaminyltransferase